MPLHRIPSMSNQGPTITSENDGDAPIDLVDDNLPKGLFAMFCLDSLDLERSDGKRGGLLAAVVANVHFRFRLE